MIDASFLDHPWYGSRQMARHLQGLGHAVGRLYPYLLRGLEITRPNHIWCAGIPYIPMRRGFLYLVAILDGASRKVLAWRLSNMMDAEFCVVAVKEARARFGKPGIFNTDRGSQFSSDDFTDVLRGAKVKISMDGRGRWMDYYNGHRPHSRVGGRTPDEVYGQTDATPYPGHAQLGYSLAHPPNCPRR